MNTSRARLELFSIFQSGQFSDTTILAEDVDDTGDTQIRSILAHRNILVAGSSFFRKIFEAPAPQDGHCSVYLKGFAYKPVYNCLCFLYSGEVSIDEAESEEFFKVFKELGLQEEREATATLSTSGQRASEKPDPDAEVLMDLSEIAVVKPDMRAMAKPLPPAPISLEDYQERIRQLVKRSPETGAPMCSFCKKEFANPHNAVNHIKSMHLPRSDYTCPYCTKAFKNSVLRSGHIHKVHYEEHRLAKVFGTSNIGGEQPLFCDIYPEGN